MAVSCESETGRQAAYAGSDDDYLHFQNPAMEKSPPTTSGLTSTIRFCVKKNNRPARVEKEY
jgi:hypothetical protein